MAVHDPTTFVSLNWQVYHWYNARFHTTGERGNVYSRTQAIGGSFLASAPGMAGEGQV